jgi:hypothetical protein
MIRQQPLGHVWTKQKYLITLHRPIRLRHASCLSHTLKPASSTRDSARGSRTSKSAASSAPPRGGITECPISARDLRQRAFPTEQAAMKCLCLVTRSLDPNGRGKARWAMRWKPALIAFEIIFGLFCAARFCRRGMGNKNYFSKRDGSSGSNPAVSRVSIAHRKALRHNPRKVVAPGPFWRAGGGERGIQRFERASHDDEDMKGYP